MAGENIVTFNLQNWEEKVIGADKPVLVDFWASWCGPCRMVGPVIEELSDDYAGKVVVGKVNVDEEGDISGKYGIMSIPSIFIFKDGKVVDKVVGFKSKADLVKMLDASL
ncbi:MAG: thioredoxin [Eubacteriales bacterium]